MIIIIIIIIIWWQLHARQWMAPRKEIVLQIFTHGILFSNLFYRPRLIRRQWRTRQPKETNKKLKAICTMRCASPYDRISWFFVVVRCMSFSLGMCVCAINAVCDERHYDCWQNNQWGILTLGLKPCSVTTQHNSGQGRVKEHPSGSCRFLPFNF